MEALIFFLHAFYFLGNIDWYMTGVVMVCFWIVMFFGSLFFGLYSFLGSLYVTGVGLLVCVK
jgi:hypothetical protein